MAQVRANNLIQEYVTNSFMSANEKFNSALVFETLPEQINLKNEEEKIQSLISAKQIQNPLEVESGEAKEQNKEEQQ